MRPFLLFLVFSSFIVTAQAQYKSTSQISWQSDSSIELTFQSTNFQKEQLINLKIVNNSMGYQQFSFKVDSVLIRKGISIFKKEFEVDCTVINQYSDTLYFEVSVSSVGNNISSLVHNVTVLPRKLNWSKINISDSLISIPHKSSGISYSISSSNKSDFLNPKSSFYLASDTIIHWNQLIQYEPLKKRRFTLTQNNKSGEQKETQFWYKEGKLFSKEPKLEIFDSLLASSKTRPLQIKGSFFWESNFFNDIPRHSNGSQYPYTSIQADNSVSILGIPFLIRGSHNTNDNISPNFRNFFSVQFDVESFRKGIEEKLKLDEFASKYSLQDVSSDIEKNIAAIDKLKDYKNVLERFPNYSPNVDSLLSNEFDQIKNSISADSLFQLDTLIPSTSIVTDSLELTSTMNSIDSISAANQKMVVRIQKGIEQLERSNELKSNYLDQLKNKKQIPFIKSFDRNELFSKVQSGGLNALLLRFNKLDIGNFYEYTGQYSIRDIELKGFNASFLLDKNNSIGILHGKVNDFQSFNLDKITDSKKISSAVYSHLSLPYLKPTLRVTQVKDETINTEISEVSEDYYITSINLDGDVKDWMNYQLEVNQSFNQLNPIAGLQETNGKNKSYFLKAGFTPLSVLDLKLQFNRVGSNYQSDGVYFLNRNFQAYTIGGKIRLFKNKIHLKSDYSIQERNFEQKDLVNKTQKQFFDVGTHFKRIPNIQVSYSPISVDVANKLDTSFSGINANTNVLIARLFYFKKIKKTFISTALVYNEIENELADEFSTQKGIQHIFNLNNEKINFSFTSAYDKYFKSVRFITVSYAQKISKKLTINTHFAKNFKKDFYSETARTNLTYQFMNKFNLGLGGIILIENRSGFVNSGGSVSLGVRY